MIRPILFPIVLLCLSLSALAQQSDSSLSELLDRYQAEPSNVRLCQQIALAYTKSNEFPQAAEFFRKALALDPQSIPSAKNLATVLWFAGQKNESITLFRSLEKKIPDDPVPQLYLALNAYDKKDMEPAALHFERAGAFASDNPEVLPFVVTAFLVTSRAHQAIDILQNRLKADNSDAQIYRWLGDVYDRQNLPQKAWDAYSKAIAAAPKSEENYLALAAFSIEHRNAAIARDVLGRGLAHLPGSAKLTLETGLVSALQGNFDQAKTEFRQASSLDPHWSLPLLALGITDLQTGDAEHATEVFQQARRVAPDDYRCYYFHALALNRSQSSSTRSQAIEELRHAIALDPNHVQPRIALAQNQLSSGNIAEAEAQLREAIRLDPSEPTALYKLALLCRREGKKQEADRLLASFQSLKKSAGADENEFVLLSQTIR
ncbi:MAG TPA: tetratricopeptide repeat protein [Bryobacteraceae bacterium]|nr:tetratricopeptide repeat protein [Bryobacteraceae bacterium]